MLLLSDEGFEALLAGVRWGLALSLGALGALGASACAVGLEAAPTAPPPPSPSVARVAAPAVRPTARPTVRPTASPIERARPLVRPRSEVASAPSPAPTPAAPPSGSLPQPWWRKPAASAPASSPSPTPASSPATASASREVLRAEFASTASAPATTAATDGALVTLDFRNADVKSIIRFLSQRTGTNYIFDEAAVSGKVSLVGPNAVPLREAVWLLESLLEFKGFTVVQVGAFRRVVPLQRAQGERIETRITLEERTGPEAEDDRVVTQLIRVEHVPLGEVEKAVAALLSRPNSIISCPQTNTLIITENALNLERVMRVVRALDVPATGRKIFVLPLRHVQVKQLAARVTDLLQQRGPGTGAPETREALAAKPALIPDERTNTLIVVCPEDVLPSVRALVEQFDRDPGAAETVAVVPVKHGDPRAIVETLKQVVGGGSGELTAVVHGTSNEVVLTSYSAALVARAKALMARLDRPSQGGDDTVVEVYRLEFAEAEKVATLLSSVGNLPPAAAAGGASSSATTTGTRSLAASRPGAPEAPRTVIVPDPSTNSLVITCPRSALEPLRRVLRSLDVVRPQVVVEVLIVEIDVNRARELGLDFNLLDANSATGTTRPFAIGNTNQLEGLVSASGISNGLSVGILTGNTFDLGALAQGDLRELSKIAVLARALRDDSRANILSAPQLVTSDNETAKISVGEQIQVPTGYSTATNTGANSITSYATEDLGIILEITPRITKNDHVVLKVNQLIKSRTADKLYDAGIPVLTKRQLETSITVAGDTTIALGGLISETKNQTQSSVPILSQLPLLGKAFRSTRNETHKTNLMVFLTPHIMRDAGAVRAMTGRQESRVSASAKTGRARDDEAFVRAFKGMLDDLGDAASKPPGS